MLSENKRASNREPTLKGTARRLSNIETHLKRQDKQAKREAAFAIGAFGSAIIMVAVGLWIERMVYSPSGFMADYAFLLICGFGILIFAWCHSRKTRS